MSSYLELARRGRARLEESGPQLVSDAVKDTRAVRQHRPLHLDSEGRTLETAGFTPKERGGKIIWQRPDTGFWVSQEMALHLLERENMKGDHGA